MLSAKMGDVAFIQSVRLAKTASDFVSLRGVAGVSNGKSHRD
jgi:hypothetical protein